MRTTKFGALSSPTPPWSKWMFRITFLLTSVITIWLAGTQLIPDNIKLEVSLILKAVDALVFGFSKMFGVKLESKS